MVNRLWTLVVETVERKVRIKGQVPAKKNNKQIVYRQSGTPFLVSNPRVQDWTQKAQACLIGEKMIKGAVKVTMRFTNRDHRKRDLDNMASTVLDAIKGILIEEDCCEVVQHIELVYGGVDSKECGVEIVIESLDIQ